jgi:ribosomal protein S12 methylthiotransferase accessory factor
VRATQDIVQYRHAADTPERVPAAWPPLAPFGITRVGDLTDLDVIGLPVWFSARPNSRVLSVSQGKGLTHEHARISAIMESVEGAVSEKTRELVSDFGSWTALKAKGRDLVPLERLDRCRHGVFAPGRERAWVPGKEWNSGRPVLAPYELVGLDLRAALPWDHSSFHMTSNGLAAGPSFEFAAAAALLELIERDATALNGLFGERTIQQLRWQPGDHAGLDEAVGKILAAGLDVRLFASVSQVRLPVISAIVTRPVLHRDGSGARLSGGDACRLDAGDAALAAVLEAAQSRLTNIAGSRDDMDDSQYGPGSGMLPDRLPDALPLSRLSEGASLRDLSPAKRLETIIAHLAAAGLDEVFLFDLPVPVSGIHVVRALVPGLKAEIHNHVTQVGAGDLHNILLGPGA